MRSIRSARAPSAVSRGDAAQLCARCRALVAHGAVCALLLRLDRTTGSLVDDVLGNTLLNVWFLFFLFFLSFFFLQIVFSFFVADFQANVNAKVTSSIVQPDQVCETKFRPENDSLLIGKMN
jgi:uncharacterized membrane protein